MGWNRVPLRLPSSGTLPRGYTLSIKFGGLKSSNRVWLPVFKS